MSCIRQLQNVSRQRATHVVCVRIPAKHPTGDDALSMAIRVRCLSWDATDQDAFVSSHLPEGNQFPADATVELTRRPHEDRLRQAAATCCSGDFSTTRRDNQHSFVYISDDTVLDNLLQLSTA